MIIIAPMHPVMLVYDLEETEGPSIPEHLRNFAKAEGDFNVFRGDLSMHRVTAVEGPRKRVVALFCYDRNPGMRYEQWYIEQLKQGLPKQAC